MGSLSADLLSRREEGVDAFWEGGGLIGVPVGKRPLMGKDHCDENLFCAQRE